MLFVAPGLLWTRLITTRLPARQESAFRDISTVALFSVPFSIFAALFTLIGATLIHERWVRDAEQWLRTGSAPKGATYCCRPFSSLSS